MDEEMDQAEARHRMTRGIIQRKRKRDNEESCETQASEEPAVGGSPTCVMVLDGEEGHADYVDSLIEKCTMIHND